MATAAQHRLTPASDTTPVIVRIPERELSGAQWVTRFPGSSSTADLVSPFREKADAFISALRAAGASVGMIATYRPKERAYLMHYASAVARGTVKAVDVPEMEGVGIEWTHSTDEESKSAAKAMANGYQIVFPPALVSRHTARVAMDISLSWTAPHPRLLISHISLPKMKSIAAFFILIQIFSNAFAVDIFSSDIRKFIDNAEACMHFSGEDGYNKERQEEIDRAVEKYCSLAKKERVFLKKNIKTKRKFKKNWMSIKMLMISFFDDDCQ